MQLAVSLVIKFEFYASNFVLKKISLIACLLKSLRILFSCL